MGGFLGNTVLTVACSARFPPWLSCWPQTCNMHWSRHPKEGHDNVWLMGSRDVHTNRSNFLVGVVGGLGYLSLSDRRRVTDWNGKWGE